MAEYHTPDDPQVESNSFSVREMSDIVIKMVANRKDFLLQVFLTKKRCFEKKAF
jgi:hypothetical protein